MALYIVKTIALLYFVCAIVTGSPKPGSLIEDPEKYPFLGLSKVENQTHTHTDSITFLHAKNNPRMQLEYYGSFAGKAYYGERTDMSWWNANTFCRNLDMELAAFASQAESNFVYSVTPSHRLWTSGQDVGRPSQVEWKTGLSPINLPLYGGVQVNTCVLLDARVDSPSSGYVYTTVCQEYYYPLCQLVH